MRQPQGIDMLDTLKTLLTEAAVSQAWLAEQIDVSAPTLNRIVHGRQEISVSRVARLAVALDMPASRVLAAAQNTWGLATGTSP